MEESEKILERFNTHRFKREQPHTKEALLGAIEYFVGLGKPIEFVMYWGKGDRDSIAGPEKEAIGLLLEMKNEIQSAYKKGAHITFIFTDTHAQLNGYALQGISSYYESLADCAGQSGITLEKMSSITPFYEKLLEEQVATVELSSDFAAILAAASEKHYKNSHSEFGAKMYYLQNQLERIAIEDKYPKSIFLTYNNSDWNPILPNKLPIFYMHSLRKGIGIKPWFAEKNL